jgi:hypothetical protein
MVATTNVTFTGDLDCPGTNGIVVGKAGITINLNGFTLSSNRTDGTTGVYNGNFPNVTVRNGTITKFRTGIGTDVGGAARMKIQNVLVSGHKFRGMYVFGESLRISGSQAFGNPSGILAYGDGVRVSSTEASGNDEFGLDLAGKSVRVSSSRAAGNGLSGILIQGDSASVSSSRTIGNGQDGVRIVGNFARVRSSLASGNELDGVDIGGDHAKVGQLRGGPRSDRNRADGNGFENGASNLLGQGYWVHGGSIALGRNIAHGNDDPAECNPSYLC